MDDKKLIQILNRGISQDLVNLDVGQLMDEKILITGAKGSIGTALVNELETHKELNFLATDIEDGYEILDITNEDSVIKTLTKYNPTMVVHLAGAKHAPEGEIDYWSTFNINTVGTHNFIKNISPDTKMILTSTCKSANPEIVYGASKLIAERMVLNSGGSVARFFNVIESSGNVFTIWENIEPNQPLEVAPICERYFITLDEALGLLKYTMMNQPGRYVVNKVKLRNMGDIAKDLYPNRQTDEIMPRRGDRLTEKFVATSESVEKLLLGDSIAKGTSIHDYVGV